MAHDLTLLAPGAADAAGRTGERDGAPDCAVTGPPLVQLDGRAGRSFHILRPVPVRFLGARVCSACRGDFITDKPAQRRCQACATAPLPWREERLREVVRKALGVAT